MSFFPQEAHDIFKSGGSTDDVVRQKILNAEGRPASSRTARRWRLYWKQQHPEEYVKTILSTTKAPPAEPVKIESPSPLAAVRPTAPRRMMRTAVFDLETSDFQTNGYNGMLAGCCILPLDSDEIQTYRLSWEDHGDDRRVLLEIIEALWEFDILIGQNNAAFDLNFLNSRRMYYGMPRMRSWWYFDTYQTAKTLAISTGKSLGNMGDYFSLPGEKTKIMETSWSKMRSPYQAEFEHAMSQIFYHCQQDVVLTRNLFDVLMPESLLLANNQMKLSKWRTGIQSWEAWAVEWKMIQAA